MSRKLRTVNIKGKDYVPVNERIACFNEAWPNGRIDTGVTYEGTYVRVRAVVTPDVANPARYFAGHAEEDREQGNINRTNATENAETSAVGRALGLMGIGILESVASHEEVAHAIYKQSVPKAESPVPTLRETELRDRIMGLVRELGIDMLGFKAGILERTKLPFVPENYAEILERLEAVSAERRKG